MKLIHFHGLNCYHDCMITLAGTFGLEYMNAFSGMWSEWDLRYDPICEVFLTRRMPDALEAMGLKLGVPCVSQKEKELEWKSCPYGTYFIIGIDARLIPWSPLYQLQNGPHYFILKKEEGSLQPCFDPTFGLSGQTLPISMLLCDAYALIPVKRIKAIVEGNPSDCLLFSQANQVIEAHPKAQSHFLQQADTWIQDVEMALHPAKFIDTLLTGRCLYRYYLEKKQVPSEKLPLFWSKAYYSDWRAVKNGFYKAALTGGKGPAFEESCERFIALLAREIKQAEQILS